MHPAHTRIDHPELRVVDSRVGVVHTHETGGRRNYLIKLLASMMSESLSSNRKETLLPLQLTLLM